MSAMSAAAARPPVAAFSRISEIASRGRGLAASGQASASTPTKRPGSAHSKMTPPAVAQGRRTATRRRPYLNQDSDKNFTVALPEYYTVNSCKVLRPMDLSEESAELLRSHDIRHVIS
jgi:hypothetical protein